MSSSTGQGTVPTPNGWLPSRERPSPDPAKSVDVGRALHLSFDFALGVQDKNAEVLASFYPHQPEDWRGGTVTFYPFLIVTKREGRDKAVWLPYWHVTQDGEKKTIKYGQWAPFMDMEFFEDLLSQTRSAGYLNDEA